MILNKEKIVIPDGEYKAIWSGFDLEIEDSKGGKHKTKSKIGCKGINCPVKVKIEDNKIVEWENNK